MILICSFSVYVYLFIWTDGKHGHFLIQEEVFNFTIQDFIIGPCVLQIKLRHNFTI